MSIRVLVKIASIRDPLRRLELIKLYKAAQEGAPVGLGWLALKYKGQPVYKALSQSLVTKSLDAAKSFGRELLGAMSRHPLRSAGIIGGLGLGLGALGMGLLRRRE